MTDNFNLNPSAPSVPHRRRSVLDLAPLELDCMNTLWPIGECTVREIRDRLAERRPRAYTTIMTIMDRLARKGIVERRKSGRAYVYRPQLTIQEARSQALGQVLDNFFAGSKEALVAQLDSPVPTRELRPLAAAARASAAAAPFPHSSSSAAERAHPAPAVTESRIAGSVPHAAPAPDAASTEVTPDPIDETLL